MRKFKYQPSSQEDLLNQAVDYLLRGCTIAEYDTESLIEMKAEAVYEKAAAEFIESNPIDTLDEQEQLVLHTMQAVDNFRTSLTEGENLQQFLYTQLEELSENNLIDLAAFDYDMQQGQYDDYCEAQMEERTLQDYLADNS